MEQSVAPPGVIVPPAAAEPPPGKTWRTWLIGRPLPNAATEHQTIGKAVGLAVFSSDALSSTAYATQEILVVLATAGAAAFWLSFPIAIAIVALLAIVTLSYRQTLYAYPSGGGAYTVARENLGERPAQIAAAALLTDYILTVAVSVSSGVAQLTSAYPALQSHRAAISVAFVMGIAVINLRGVRESGAIFAVPTYAFIVMMVVVVGAGFARLALGTLGAVPNPPHVDLTAPLKGITAFLVLHAFSSGTTALTGVEAISNGIMAFRKPRSRNASITLFWMSGILGSLFLGITYLARSVGATPSENETVISQLTRTVFGGPGTLYLTAIGSTTLILVMAANTAFADFPRLSALVAADGFLPRQLAYRGSRLVYSRGIGLLAIMASMLIVAFDASVNALIPLYAIGVFLSFTLSQAGMTLRWWHFGHDEPHDEEGGAPAAEPSPAKRDPRWLPKMLMNGFGACCTAAVVVVFTVTRFADGAWIVVVLIPVLVAWFSTVRRHYDEQSRRFSLEGFGPPPRVIRHRVIVPVSSVNRGTLAALRYARALSDDVTAVHVVTDVHPSEAFRRDWDRWGDGIRLVMLDSPYRLLLEPLLGYIESVARNMRPNETVTIVVPQFVPRRRWHNILHAQTATFLRMALYFRKGIVITSVPYGAADPDEGREPAAGPAGV